MFDEFKKFALKGNMLDMALGIIIGGAFATIVKSLVDDILMPPLGMAMGGMDFSNLSIILKEEVGEKPAVAIRYGSFINSIIAFLIVAFALYMLMKAINRLMVKKAATPPAPPPPVKTELLLAEIRDLLAERRT